MSDLWGNALESRTVTILVGPVPYKWIVHEELLCHHSRFFEAALRGEFQEAKSGVIELPEEESEVFALCLRWLYAGTINDETRKSQLPEPVAPAAARGIGSKGAWEVVQSLKGCRPQMPPPMDTDKADEKGFTAKSTETPTIQHYLHLYIMACKFLIRQLENTCIDIVITYFRQHPKEVTILYVAYIYQHTPGPCGMRDLLRKLLISSTFGQAVLPHEEWRDVLDDVPELATDIALQFRKAAITGEMTGSRDGDVDVGSHTTFYTRTTPREVADI